MIHALRQTPCPASNLPGQYCHNANLTFPGFVTGAGVTMTSSDREYPLLTATFHKRFALLEGPNTLLSVRAHADFDPRRQEASIDTVEFELWP